MALHQSSLVDNTDLQRKMTFFYTTAADTILHFKFGDPLTINNSMLSFHSAEFDRMFFSKNSDVFIDEFDSETFKIFLDCLFEFKPYNVTDALRIFPIAHKYNVKKSLDSCKKVLNPNSMDENVCLTLNLSVKYVCDDLTKNVIDFMTNNYGLMNVIEDEKYCFLLEPLSMAVLIQQIEMDSYLLKKIYEWGINHLKKEDENFDISAFFKEHNILKNVSLMDVFESAKSIFESNEFIAMKDIFSSDEILAYLKSNICDGHNKIPSKSEWVQVQKHFAIKEHIEFNIPMLIPPEKELDEVFLSIGTNKVVFFISPHLNRLYNALGLTWAELITCKVFCTWKENNISKVCHQRQHPYMREEQSASKNFLTPSNVVHKNKKFVYSVKLPLKPYYSELMAVDITYTFSFKCRILKTSMDVMQNAIDDKNLCFTSFIKLQMREER